MTAGGGSQMSSDAGECMHYSVDEGCGVLEGPGFPGCYNSGCPAPRCIPEQSIVVLPPRDSMTGHQIPGVCVTYCSCRCLDRPLYGSPLKDICGPDTTDWLVEALAGSYEHTIDPFHPSGSLGAMAGVWRDGGAHDLKEYRVRSYECPRGNCYYAATLCGVCVEQDVPGNIVLGFIIGADAAGAIGRGLGAFGGAEDPHDIVAYGVGEDARSRGGFMREGAGGHPTADRQLLKSQICEALNGLVSGGGGEGMTSQCKPCAPGPYGMTPR